MGNRRELRKLTPACGSASSRRFPLNRVLLVAAVGAVRAQACVPARMPRGKTPSLQAPAASCCPTRRRRLYLSTQFRSRTWRSGCGVIWSSCRSPADLPGPPNHELEGETGLFRGYPGAGGSAAGACLTIGSGQRARRGVKPFSCPRGVKRGVRSAPYLHPENLGGPEAGTPAAIRRRDFGSGSGRPILHQGSDHQPLTTGPAGFFCLCPELRSAVS
jgi:hypothetical protein